MNENEFQTLKADIAAFVRGRGEQIGEQIERERKVDPAVWSELRERNYLRLAAPAELGGLGIEFSRYLELMELFAQMHASLRMIVHVVNGIWRAVDQLASPGQRERFTKPLVAGDIKVAFTLTEPNAGTGADIRCSVRREGDTYYLSGEKHLITFGMIADYLLLFARLEGTHGSEGTVALLVPRDAPGLTANEMPESMGVHGTDHAHLVFHDTPVPVANRLGAEGEGLRVAFEGFLAPSRISVAMSCVGLATRALDLARERALARVTFGKPLAERQAIRFMLAEMATDLAAAKQLTVWAAREWESGGDHVVESSMAKLFATQMLQRVTDKALQIHGGIGYFAATPMERVYRDARAQRFEEGTNEIQKTVIARGLLHKSLHEGN
ncbi:MAG: acyl-CoA dehydrogenase family protein [Rhodanobacteraceae bacterium]